MGVQFVILRSLAAGGILVGLRYRLLIYRSRMLIDGGRLLIDWGGLLFHWGRARCEGRTRLASGGCRAVLRHCEIWGCQAYKR